MDCIRVRCNPPIFPTSYSQTGYRMLNHEMIYKLQPHTAAANAHVAGKLENAVTNELLVVVSACPVGPNRHPCPLT